MAWLSGLGSAVGYVEAEDGQLDKDPARRVQDGIALVFRKFAELQSIRQVLLWLRQEYVLVPAAVPVYHTMHHMLTNPVYAGAYAFGPRGTRVVIEGGRKRVMRDSMRRNWKDWEVLIRGHHDAYISWEEFERNQHPIPTTPTARVTLGAGDPPRRSLAARPIPVRKMRPSIGILWPCSPDLGLRTLTWECWPPCKWMVRTTSRTDTVAEALSCASLVGRCRRLQCCEPTAEERGAGKPRATFCGNRAGTGGGRPPPCPGGRRREASPYPDQSANMRAISATFSAETHRQRSVAGCPLA